MSNLFLFSPATSQRYDLRGYFGASYYLGDLAPYSHTLSYAEGHPAVGISLGIKLDDVFKLHTRIVRAYLSGDDINSINTGRQNRNLHFVSPLYEFGLFVDINLNSLISILDKYGINIFLTNGLTLFKFNPQAYYNGHLISLQPLSTEGQGYPEINKDQPYKLLQLALATGIGFDFKIAKSLNFGLEILPRKTFTDYLDDVSGSYINYDEQRSLQGELSANLANRTWELNEGVPIQYPTGTRRGNPTNFDWYLITSVYVSYRFPNIKEKEASKQR